MILSVICAISILNLLVFDITNVYVISLFLFFFLIIVKFTLGYEKDRGRFKKDALLNIFIYVMVYHILTYIIGIFLGFVRNIYDLSFLVILENIVPVILAIIVTETLRYMINKKCEDSKYLLLFSTIVFTLIDIVFLVSFYNYLGSDLWFTITALAVLPSISKNIFLSYTVYKFGLMPAILYRLLIELPAYIIPIFPNFNEYLDAVFNFILPFLIFWFVYRDIIKKQKKKNKEHDSSLDKHIVSKLMSLALIMFTIVVIGLTSNVFTYFTLSIGSGSMSPQINKGDIVIVEKIKEDEIATLKEGDVLVFEQEGVVVVHRIEEISEKNDSYLFSTKGDNNNDVDNWVVTEDRIIGKVLYKIAYMGFPTIWLNEFISN